MVSKHISGKVGYAPPETATRVLKRRGRKTNKIVQAFDNVPVVPVEFEKYAEKYNVSTNVLKQIKRFDTFTNRGKVFIRKDKQTKTVMIWREISQTKK